MSTSATGARRRRGPRIVVAIGLLLCVGALYAGPVARLGSLVGSSSRLVAAEREGAAYLRPLTRLMVELGTAQSAAVRGQSVAAADVRAAEAAVSEVDGRVGAGLRTSQRWTDLRGAIDKALADGPVGQAGLDRFTDLSALAGELGRTAGDASHLVVDPELDTFYLMDTALLELPTVLLAAGEVADLNLLAAQSRTGSQDGSADPADLVDIAVARYQVATGTDATGAGLRKAMDATTLDPGVAEQLERLPRRGRPDHRAGGGASGIPAGAG